MGRAVVTVRDAGAADLDALVALWDQLRRDGFRRRTSPAEPRESAYERFTLALADSTSRVLVAVCDGEIIGMAQLSRTPLALLAESPSLELSAMCVADAHRRKGAGKALVAAAAAHAEELGLESLVVSVFPQHREANRFYARLGFAPLVVRRVANVAALRRRLGSPDGRAALLRRELHMPRRVARRRRVAPPAPVGDRPAD